MSGHFSHQGWQEVGAGLILPECNWRALAAASWVFSSLLGTGVWGQSAPQALSQELQEPWCAQPEPCKAEEGQGWKPDTARPASPPLGKGEASLVEGGRLVCPSLE